MTKIKTLIGTTVASGALVGLAPPAAEAAPPEPFTITETLDLREGGVDTFTATGGALCESGMFVDEVVVFARRPDKSGRLNLQIRTVYTCDDGSGSFFAQKLVPLNYTEDGATNSGPITLKGGTGDYTRLSGHGLDVGRTIGEQSFGQISGVLTLT
jgi:hypothetical protein